MTKSRTEEQFPLLMFLVGDQEVSKNNRRFWNRGRFDGITSGASAIITEWPNYLSSCWVTALICGIALFIISLLMTSCISFQYGHRLPRCVLNYDLDNRTIHLVHSSRKWSQDQFDLINNITIFFPNYKIHLIIITNKLTDIQMNNSSVMMKVLTGDKLPITDDLLTKNPNLLVTYTSYKSVFENTPLYLSWLSMNDQMRIFSVRTLQIWQFGGLSFDLMEYNLLFKNKTEWMMTTVDNLIRNGQRRYENLQPEVVSIDVNGLHMESKTPCHAFFGKILKKLTKMNEKMNPRSVLFGPMYTYCRVGAIDSQFCLSKNILLF